jgi:hypothetical protein
MDLAGWISTSINVVLLASFYFGKKWIETNVERSVRHKFDEKLEATKSDLRAKEAEISALRDMVLSGSAQRRALLDNRRLVAVERIWANVGKLAPFTMASAAMATISFDAAARRVPNDPNLRKFFDVIANPTLPENIKSETAAVTEQPFLSPLAWAYFNAYQSIVMNGYLHARMLAEGVADASRFLKRDRVQDLLKVVLPHRGEFIDRNGPSAYHFLLDELKDRLLLELKKMLEGEDANRAAIDQAKQIAELIGKMETERIDQDVAVAKAEAKL